MEQRFGMPDPGFRVEEEGEIREGEIVGGMLSLVEIGKTAL